MKRGRTLFWEKKVYLGTYVSQLICAKILKVHLISSDFIPSSSIHSSVYLFITLSSNPVHPLKPFQLSSHHPDIHPPHQAIHYRNLYLLVIVVVLRLPLNHLSLIPHQFTTHPSIHHPSMNKPTQ